MFMTGDSERFEIELTRATGEDPPFYCVSPTKFLLLAFSSLGVYQIIWFYKNWKLVKARTGRDISPFARALFSPWYCYDLARTVDSAAASVQLTQRIRPGLIAGLYAVLLMSERLPDPYWMICLFSFVPLLPIVRQIREIHGAIRPGFDFAVGWGGWSITTVTLGVPVIALLLFSGIAAVPTEVLRSSEIPPSYHGTLVEAGILTPDEQIQFFSSSGFISILEDGSLLTESRVVSYETWDDELYVYSSAYRDVRDIDVEYSESFLDDTTVTILPVSDDSFSLFLSAEEGRDKEFVSDLERRVEKSRGP